MNKTLLNLPRFVVGAMLPYWFSAMAMKSIGSAALKMVEEVHRQFNTIPGLMEGTTKPDYATCVKISTDASSKEMVAPDALVMLTPLIVGIIFGVETSSGILRTYDHAISILIPIDHANIYFNTNLVL